MKLSLRRIRLRAGWFVVPFFLWLARPSVPLLIAGGVLAALGTFVRAWAAGTIHKDRTLTTVGPYAHTRNPLYLGSFLIGLGVALASHAVFVAAFLVFFALVYFPTMRREEAHLERLFGEEYVRYAKSVPLLLPSLRRYRPAERPADPAEPVPGSSAAPGGAPVRVGGFSLERYRRNREWEALLGVSVAFAALVLKLVID